MASTRVEKTRLFVELAAGLAVLVGLVFVGLELRQNTAAMQAATFQDLVPCVERLHHHDRRGPPGGLAHWPQDGNLAQPFKDFLDSCDG